MAERKKGAKKVAEKKVSEREEIADETPVMKETFYNLDNKSELKEVPVVPINQSEHEVLKESPIIEISDNSKLRKKGIKTLTILIIILLVIDIASLYFYYKPDLSGLTSFFKFKIGKIVEPVGSDKCKDGTALDNCSKDKPYYCYNGELIKKAATCGCPSGYKADFQDCKKI